MTGQNHLCVSNYRPPPPKLTYLCFEFVYDKVSEFGEFPQWVSSKLIGNPSSPGSIQKEEGVKGVGGG
jgi:hypothetical protein